VMPTWPSARKPLKLWASALVAASPMPRESAETAARCNRFMI